MSHRPDDVRIHVWVSDREQREIQDLARYLGIKQGSGAVIRYALNKLSQSVGRGKILEIRERVGNPKALEKAREVKKDHKESPWLDPTNPKYANFRR